MAFEKLTFVIKYSAEGNTGSFFKGKLGVALMTPNLVFYAAT